MFVFYSEVQYLVRTEQTAFITSLFDMCRFRRAPYVFVLLLGLFVVVCVFIWFMLFRLVRVFMVYCDVFVGLEAARVHNTHLSRARWILHAVFGSDVLIYLVMVDLFVLKCEDGVVRWYCEDKLLQLIPEST